MKLRDVKWHNKTKRFSQVSNKGLEFAFLDHKYEQIHQLVWCKDFMQDAIHGFINCRKTSIYGFTYDPVGMLPLHMETTRLMLASKSDHEFSKKIINSLIFMNKIEKHLKMAQTIAEKCKSPPRHYKRSGVFIFNGSKRWMKAPPLISLYTLMIRVGLAHDPNEPWQTTIEDIRNEKREPYYSYDKGFLKNGQIGLDRIFRYGDRKIFHRKTRDNFPPSVETSKMHNDFGIIGYSIGATRTQCPHWHRNLEKKQ